MCVLDKLESCGYLYASINHDKDVVTEDDLKKRDDLILGTPKKAHTHVVLKFKNPRCPSAICKELGIESNYLQECRNLKGALLYLVHAGDPVRYQYDLEDVCGPLKFELGKYLDDKDEGSRVLRILDLLDEMPTPCSYRKLLVSVCERGLYGEFRRMGSGVMKLLDEHNGYC